MQTRKFADIRFLYVIALLLFVVATVRAQENTTDSSSLRDTVRQLQLQIQQLQAVTQEMKQEANRYRAETLQLKNELDLTRQKLDALAGAAGIPQTVRASASEIPQQDQPETAPGDDKSLPQRVTKLEEDHQLLSDKVDEQYQTKVETASKHRVKLSGILLMNIFSNTGNVDHVEVPGVALSAPTSQTSANTGGSFGATFRQSELGLEVYGPTFAGAKTRGNFVGDFFSESPETINGNSSGMFHLRTGTVRLDWERTSVVGGVDTLFFSPTYPTSYASVGIPAFSYSGNLWGWTAQLRVEHRLISSDDSALTVSGGILDPLTGEAPQNEFLRFPGAGESSRQPAYAGRLEWRRKIFGQPLTVGAGAYYSREAWAVNRNIDGWAATNDWLIPFGSHLSLSGKFYAGRAIGGLGAGIGRSIVFNSPSGVLTDPASTLQALESFGGWSQFKIKANAKLEFNVAAGQDSAAADDVRGFANTTGYLAANLNQNRSEFVNFVYRPRSSLLFSTEFRTLRTTAVSGINSRANQLNLVMGVLF